jgi:hypothetical protein
MKIQSEFEAEYEVYDGYATGRRPKYFKIGKEEILKDKSDWDDDTLLDFYYNAMQDDFEANVGPAPNNEDSFLEWAWKVLEENDE